MSFPRLEKHQMRCREKSCDGYLAVVCRGEQSQLEPLKALEAMATRAGWNLKTGHCPRHNSYPWVR